MLQELISHQAQMMMEITNEVKESFLQALALTNREEEPQTRDEEDDDA